MASNSDSWRKTRPRRADWAVALLLVVTAVLVRWPFISQGHTVLHSDEAIVGLMADDIAAGDRFPLYFYGQRYMGALEAYVIAGLRRLTVPPLTSLRLGPALFLGLLVASQYLMLTCWFGRVGGLIGAVSLLAAPPWIMQWTAVARGGYVEIMLWGTLLWWCYGLWFTGDRPPTTRHKVVLGFLVGSGIWLNPTIVAFVAPVLGHYLLGSPLAGLRRSRIGGIGFRFVDRCLPRLPIVLPALVILSFVAVSSVYSVRVTESGVRHELLSGVVSRPVAVAILGIGTGAVVVVALRRRRVRNRVRAGLNAAGPLILGCVVGLSPAIAYVAHRALTRQPLEDCLPLGVRPAWAVGQTAGYLLHGLPMLLGADPRPTFDLIQSGRQHALADPTVPTRFAVQVAAWVSLACAAFLGVSFSVGARRELWAMSRLRAGDYSPRAFLSLATLGLCGLYLISGCSLDFMSVRYLVPLWVAIPGLLAALWTNGPPRRSNRIAISGALTAWCVGQLGYFAQLGAPHPLDDVARRLQALQIREVTAETLDAHLLTYLTEQQCRVVEFRPFWSRLAHRNADGSPAPRRYLVPTRWNEPVWNGPGPAPVQTSRSLASTLRAWLELHPDALVYRQPLVEGYELWTLREPVPDSFAPHASAVALGSPATVPPAPP